jgi:hypothetical protein
MKRLSKLKCIENEDKTQYTLELERSDQDNTKVLIQNGACLGVV